MNGQFNVNQYWLSRGRNYIKESLPEEYHRLQERFLLEMVRLSRLPMTKVLEIGCGFGRITRLLADSFPRAQITALDLSPEQLANAKRYCADRENITFQPFDFYSGAPFPGSGYDATIAIEVFLHHPRPVVEGLLAKLANISQYVLNIDWSEDWPWKTPEHVWVHDYQAAYEAAGLDCATFRLPQKIDGMQQKLFIAAKQFTPELRRLERQAREVEAIAENSAAVAMPLPAEVTGSGGASWAHQLQLAIQEILETVPAGNTLILVNDDQWGREQEALTGRRVLPFLEREGRYWGAPADDETAIRELERLRRAGARFLIFAWSSFWWLEHYSGLRGHLRRIGSCVLENERLVIFTLN